MWNEGQQTFSVKGQIVSVVGFVGHLVSGVRLLWLGVPICLSKAPAIVWPPVSASPPLTFYLEQTVLEGLMLKLKFQYFGHLM